MMGFHASFTAEAGKNYCFVRRVSSLSPLTDDKARTYAKHYTLSVDSGPGLRAVLKVAPTVQLEATTAGLLNLLGLNPHLRLICSFGLSSADGRPFRASPGHPVGLKPGHHSTTFTYHLEPPSGYKFTRHHPEIIRTFDVKLEAGKTYIATYELQSESVTITEEVNVP